MTGEQTALNLPAMVRSRDYRRFLAIQFATPAERPILYALTAFAAEMNEIPNHVREPLAGFMRYAWWREALQAMEASAPSPWRGEGRGEGAAPELGGTAAPPPDPSDRPPPSRGRLDHPLLQELAPWLSVHPVAFGLLYTLIERGQHSIEDGKSEAQAMASDATLTNLWECALNGANDTPLKTLKSLPFGQRIGPLRIMHIIAKGLIS